jgi:hypothetical protein
MYANCICQWHTFGDDIILVQRRAYVDDIYGQDLVIKVINKYPITFKGTFAINRRATQLRGQVRNTFTYINSFVAASGTTSDKDQQGRYD